jgi:hypothetical protein
MSKVAIHLNVHNHLITDGKCRELVKETRRLKAKEVDRMPNAKISLISLNANKTLLMSYLLDYFSDGTMELLKGKTYLGKIL